MLLFLVLQRRFHCKMRAFWVCLFPGWENSIFVDSLASQIVFILGCRMPWTFSKRFEFFNFCRKNCVWPVRRVFLKKGDHGWYFVQNMKKTSKLGVPTILTFGMGLNWSDLALTHVVIILEKSCKVWLIFVNLKAENNRF